MPIVHLVLSLQSQPVGPANRVLVVMCRHYIRDVDWRQAIGERRLPLPLSTLRVLMLLGIDQLADPRWYVCVSPQRMALLGIVDKLCQNTGIKFIMLPVIWIRQRSFRLDRNTYFAASFSPKAAAASASASGPKKRRALARGSVLYRL